MNGEGRRGERIENRVMLELLSPTQGILQRSSVTQLEALQNGLRHALSRQMAGEVSNA